MSGNWVGLTSHALSPNVFITEPSHSSTTSQAEQSVMNAIRISYPSHKSWIYTRTLLSSEVTSQQTFMITLLLGNNDESKQLSYCQVHRTILCRLSTHAITELTNTTLLLKPNLKFMLQRLPTGTTLQYIWRPEFYLQFWMKMR
jgi:hypothetical protein